jgi:hypothetical protein
MRPEDLAGNGYQESGRPSSHFRGHQAAAEQGYDQSQAKEYGTDAIAYP